MFGSIFSFCGKLILPEVCIKHKGKEEIRKNRRCWVGRNFVERIINNDLTFFAVTVSEVWMPVSSVIFFPNTSAGSIAIRAGSKDLFDTVVVVHPGRTNVEEIRAIKVPSLWLCAEGT